jgi:hypothetical protein
VLRHPSEGNMEPRRCRDATQTRVLHDARDRLSPRSARSSRWAHVRFNEDTFGVDHAFVEKTQKAPVSALDRSTAGQGGDVTTISLRKVARRWMKEPGFKAGYDALPVPDPQLVAHTLRSHMHDVPVPSMVRKARHRDPSDRQCGRWRRAARH